MSVSPRRPVKLTCVPAVLPLQAAMASGGGPGGLPLGGAMSLSAAWDKGAASRQATKIGKKMRCEYAMERGLR